MLDMILRFATINDVNKFLKANDISKEESEKLRQKWLDAQEEAIARPAAPAPAPVVEEVEEEDEDEEEEETEVKKVMSSTGSSFTNFIKK